VRESPKRSKATLGGGDARKKGGEEERGCEVKGEEVNNERKKTVSDASRTREG